MKLDTICAYVFRADLFCVPCITFEIAKDIDVPGLKDKVLDPNIRSEEALDILALEMGIDRHAEYEYDSGEFPKIAFGEFVTEDDNCARCGERLL